MAHDGQRTLAALVGRTPLIELRNLSPRSGVRLFAKLEGQNPSGSVKDRIAVAMLDAAEVSGALRPGATLVEASTGNTAIALAALAPRRGYRVRVVLPKGIVPSIADILDLYGAEIEWCEPEAGMRGAIRRVQELAEQQGYHAVGQFSDPANVRCHYATTGEEIAQAMEGVDVFIAGIGTGGTITGVARRLREQWPDVQVVGVEPRLGGAAAGAAQPLGGLHPAAARPRPAEPALPRRQRERHRGGAGRDAGRGRLRRDIVRRGAAHRSARRRGEWRAGTSS